MNTYFEILRSSRLSSAWGLEAFLTLSLAALASAWASKHGLGINFILILNWKIILKIFHSTIFNIFYKLSYIKKCSFKLYSMRRILPRKMITFACFHLAPISSGQLDNPRACPMCHVVQGTIWMDSGLLSSFCYDKEAFKALVWITGLAMNIWWERNKNR